MCDFFYKKDMYLFSNKYYVNVLVYFLVYYISIVVEGYFNDF